MTTEDFRRLALGFSDVVESSHGGHPDFRTNGRVFASLGVPDEDWGMVAVPPETQLSLTRSSPGAFRPAAGAWGTRGYTCVHLADADVATVQNALKSAHDWAHAKKPRKS